jgi:S-adenosylmethionine hydrolase
MSNWLITLTTDFGTSDHFVGAMKGVIIRIAPPARVIDITHEIAPYNALEGAFVIAQAAPYFPKGTIHVVVVDPGVGSDRRGILVEMGEQFFLGPDNGVLSMIFAQGPHTVRTITNSILARKDISRTFHGRDIFAPAAAHLARGVKPEQFGKIIQDYVRIDAVEPREIGPSTWRGVILKVDRFGNLITNFHIDEFFAIKTNPFVMKAGSAAIRRLAPTFADAGAGEPVVVVGSSGYLEIVVNQASAAMELGCSAGAAVEIEIDVPSTGTRGKKKRIPRLRSG